MEEAASRLGVVVGCNSTDSICNQVKGGVWHENEVKRGQGREVKSEVKREIKRRSRERSRERERECGRKAHLMSAGPVVADIRPPCFYIHDAAFQSKIERECVSS